MPDSFEKSNSYRHVPHTPTTNFHRHSHRPQTLTKPNNKSNSPLTPNNPRRPRLHHLDLPLTIPLPTRRQWLNHRPQRYLAPLPHTCRSGNKLGSELEDALGHLDGVINILRVDFNPKAEIQRGSESKILMATVTLISSIKSIPLSISSSLTICKVTLFHRCHLERCADPVPR